MLEYSLKPLCLSSIYKGYLVKFSVQARKIIMIKIKKIHPEIKFLIFREMELLSSNINKFQETKTPPKSPYISRNGNLKKASYISGNGTIQSTPRKISYTSGNRSPEKISYIFTKERFSYISGNGNPENSLYFRKRNFLIFQERYIQNSGIFKTLVYSKP